ncbi:MAG: ATP-binding cassette domain-containing protein [Lachnospiraceae bacterium]|nr:ATP-binding cassette domain-containing protein [Lachnospiraceae bacterium]MBQ4067837.1 ATP-binding cassette domain-containing protein [Lachnospiraceae bacterium]
MIVLKDVNKEIKGKKILRDITFHISQNEKVGIIGLNGAGKTSLLNIIAGMLRPSSGFIRVNGVENLVDNREELKNISYISGTKSQLWEDLAVKDSYDNLAKMYGINKGELKLRLDNLSQVFDIGNYLSFRPKDLSLGEKMRCELVYGLLANPNLLMIDEALIGLDVSVKHKIMKYFESYKEENQSTIIYTSNNLSEVERICNRIIVIDKGQIIYDGDIDRILKEFAPLNKVEIQLDGSVPDLGDLPVERFEMDNEKIIIEYEKNKVDTAQIIKHVMENCKVYNIKLHEPDLEDVIKKVYERKG